MARKRFAMIGFRWSPEIHDDEKQAEAIRQSYLEEGFNDRQIYAQALIHFKGQKIKEIANRDVLARLKRIEGKIDLQAEQNAMIVEALGNMDLSAFVNPQTGRTFSEELGERVPQSAYSQIQQSVSAQDFDID